MERLRSLTLCVECPVAPTLVPGEGILAHQAVSGVDHEGTDINGVDCDRIPSRGEGWISGSIPSVTLGPTGGHGGGCRQLGLRTGEHIEGMKIKMESPQSDDLRQTKNTSGEWEVGWKHRSLSDGTK